MPSDAEWQTLEIYLGMSKSDADDIFDRGTDEGGKLKKTGTEHWANPNIGATNESGFSALPGGYRFSDGTYNVLRLSARFLTSDAWYRSLDHADSDIYRYALGNNIGHSVRCVKD